MGRGGFKVMFDGKVVSRCYAVAVDYDTFECKFNDDKPVVMPKGLKEIRVVLEKDE